MMRPVTLRTMVAAAVFIALVAVGCSSNNTSAPKVSKTTIPPEDRTPTTLTLWSSFSDTETIDAFKPMIDRCEKDNPWLTIKYVAKDEIATALAAAAESGDVPDLVQADLSGGLAALEAANIVLPLDDYAKRDGLDWSTFTPGSEKLVTFDQKHWAIPFSVDTAALFYNQDALDEVGIAKPPSTFAELKSAAEKLIKRKSDGTIERIGWVPDVGDGSFVMGMGLIFGGTTFSEDGTKVTLTQTDAWKESFIWQKQFYDLLDPKSELTRFFDSLGAYDSSENFFITGQVPLYLEASYFATWPERFGKGKPEHWGVTPMPGPNGVADAENFSIVASGNFFLIPTKAKDPDASWIAARCLATGAKEIADFQEVNGNIPANIEALGLFEEAVTKKTPNFQTFIDLARSPKAVVPANGVIINTLTDEVTQLALDFRAGKVKEKDLGGEIAKLESRLQDELDLELGTN